MTGYADASYAESLHEFGQPIRLEKSGASLLCRPIAGTPYFDAMGPYPLFSASNWSRIEEDFVSLDEKIVSATIVTDPFAELDEGRLEQVFPDLCYRYKPHYVVEFPANPNVFVDSHHRYYARWALKRLKVDVVEQPAEFLEEWCRLYDALVARHGIVGIRAFSRESFARQFQVPGFFALRAKEGEKTVGGQLWFLANDCAYSHLTCCDETGYRTRASYALYWMALEHFKTRCRSLDLGAAAGAAPSAGETGLDTFKKGWSTGTKDVFLAGRVMDRDVYQQLVESKGVRETHYFPAYRHGEFL